jgi:hypothetical protein
MPLRSPGTTVARTDAEIVDAVEDSAVALAAGSTVGGTAIASTDDVRTDAEIVAAVEASATLDLDAGATIGGSGIVSDADLALVALDDLADVSVVSPSDQDVLTWDDGTSTWVAQAAAGGGGGYDGDVATSIELTRTTAVSTGADSIVIGNDASATGFNTIVIGHDATADQSECVVIGGNAKSEATGYRHTVIGHGSRADSQGQVSAYGHVAIGYGAEADAFYWNEIAIGLAADALGMGLAICALAVASDLGCVAIGHGADATADDAIAIGTDAQGTANNAVAIGHDARSTVEDAVSLGYDAEATQADAIAIGALSRASRTSSIVLNATGAAAAPLTRDSTRINKLFHVVELRAAPSDGTPTEATSDGAAASTGDDAARNVVVLADGKVVGFTLCMTAIQATTNDAAFYEIVGAAKCLSGTASIIGTNTTIAKEDDAGWDCTVTCTSNRLVVTCTADAGGASTWRGTLTLTYED